MSVIEGKRIIVQLHKELYTLSKLEEDNYKSESIKSFIAKRQDDLINNPKQMITSILERKRNKITLDRLLVSKEDKKILLVKPNDINQAIIDHYQYSAQGTNEIKLLNHRWQ